MVAPGVEVPVDLGRDERGEQFLGDPVVHGDALALAVVFVHAHGLEADRGGEELMGDLMVRTAPPVYGVVSVPVAIMMLPEKCHRPEATRQRGMLT
jgi:hypothetical protein